MYFVLLIAAAVRVAVGFGFEAAGVLVLPGVAAERSESFGFFASPDGTESLFVARELPGVGAGDAGMLVSEFAGDGCGVGSPVGVVASWFACFGASVAVDGSTVGVGTGEVSAAALMVRGRDAADSFVVVLDSVVGGAFCATADRLSMSWILSPTFWAIEFTKLNSWSTASANWLIIGDALLAHLAEQSFVIILNEALNCINELLS